jgi:hypothetical protein
MADEDVKILYVPESQKKSLLDILLPVCQQHGFDYALPDVPLEACRVSYRICGTNEGT